MVRFQETITKAECLADKWINMKKQETTRNETILACFHKNVELLQILTLGFHDTKEEILLIWQYRRFGDEFNKNTS